MAHRLTNPARTLLRSRLRRHPDNLMIEQHMLGQYGTDKIADLKNADLITTAHVFNVPLPTDAEVQAYVDAKDQGYSGAQAIAAADAVGPGPVDPNASNQFDPDDEADGPDVDDEADADATPDADADADREDDADDADDEDKIKASMDRVLNPLGTGDFVTFNARLKELATEAAKPAVIQNAPAYVDPSKITGRVPQMTGRKGAGQVGLSLPVPDKATELPVYDAEDAPAVDKDFRWPDATGAALTQIRRGHAVFAYGPAGTGKTTWAKQIAARWGRSFVRISCDDQTEAAMLTGMTVPANDGGTKWQDGQLTAAIRKPGTVVLIDEPSVARPGALFVLQAVLDSDRTLHIAETGEVVQVAPDVVFIIADNTNGTGDATGQYEATRRLNRAFLDRAGATIRFDYMDPTEEAKALTARTGCKRPLAAKLAKFAALTRREADGGNVAHPVGFRRLVSIAELITDGVDAHQAYQIAVIETAPHDDREPLRQMWTTEVKPDELAA